MVVSGHRGNAIDKDTNFPDRSIKYDIVTTLPTVSCEFAGPKSNGRDDLGEEHWQGGQRHSGSVPLVKT